MNIKQNCGEGRSSQRNECHWPRPPRTRVLSHSPDPHLLPQQKEKAVHVIGSVTNFAPALPLHAHRKLSSMDAQRFFRDCRQGNDVDANHPKKTESGRQRADYRAGRHACSFELRGRNRSLRATSWIRRYAAPALLTSLLPPTLSSFVASRFPYGSVVVVLHRPLHLGILRRRRRQQVVRQGPHGVELEALDPFGVPLAAVFLELVPDEPPERHRLGARAAGRDVPDQSEAVPVQLSVRKRRGKFEGGVEVRRRGPFFEAELTRLSCCAKRACTILTHVPESRSAGTKRGMPC